jgi:ribosomal-protein-alanine N-acetyltransferase
MLSSSRLQLRPFTANDLDVLYRLLSDPLVMRYLVDGTLYSLDETKTILDKVMAHYERHGFGALAVTEKNSKSVIGWGGLIRLAYDDHAKDIEVLYSLEPSKWGRGYATEIAHIMVDWGFKNLNVGHLVGVADAYNIGSRQVLEKSGMHFTHSGLYQGYEKLFYRIEKPQSSQ